MTYSPPLPLVQGVRVYHSAAQSLVNNTDTLLTWDSEEFDTLSFHDPAVNPQRLTCQRAGYYYCQANIIFATNATGVRQAYLLLNGVAVPRRISCGVTAPATTILPALNFSGVLSLVVGDYLTVNALQTSGGALDVDALSNFEMIRLGR